MVDHIVSADPLAYCHVEPATAKPSFRPTLWRFMGFAPEIRPPRTFWERRPWRERASNGRVTVVSSNRSFETLPPFAEYLDAAASSLFVAGVGC